MSCGAGPAPPPAQPAFGQPPAQPPAYTPFNSAPSPFSSAPAAAPPPFARPPAQHGWADWQSGPGAQQPRRSSVQMSDAPPFPREQGAPGQRYPYGLQERNSKRELAHRRLDELLDELEE